MDNLIQSSPSVLEDLNEILRLKGIAAKKILKSTRGDLVYLQQTMKELQHSIAMHLVSLEPIKHWSEALDFSRDKTQFMNDLDELETFVTEMKKHVNLQMEIKNIRNEICEAVEDEQRSLESFQQQLCQLLKIGQEHWSGTRSQILARLLDSCDNFLESPGPAFEFDKRKSPAKDGGSSTQLVSLPGTPTASILTPIAMPNTVDALLSAPIETESSDFASSKHVGSIKMESTESNHKEFHWINSGTNNGVQYYFCGERNTLGCAAKKSYRKVNNTFSFSGHHNHFPTRAPSGRSLVEGKRSAALSSEAVSYVESKLKVGAKPQQIFEGAPPALGLTPKNISNYSSRSKAKEYKLDNHVLDSIRLAFGKYGKTFTNFLIGCGSDPDPFYLAFATPAGLQRLRNSPHMFVDGIHKCVEGNLLTTIVVVRVGHKAVPCVFFVHEESTEVAYSNLFKKLLDTVGDWKPRAVITDFESALMASLKTTFSESQVWGDALHRLQATNDKLESLADSGFLISPNDVKKLKGDLHNLLTCVDLDSFEAAYTTFLTWCQTVSPEYYEYEKTQWAPKKKLWAMGFRANDINPQKGTISEAYNSRWREKCEEEKTFFGPLDKYAHFIWKELTWWDGQTVDQILALNTQAATTQNQRLRKRYAESAIFTRGNAYATENSLAHGKRQAKNNFESTKSNFPHSFPSNTALRVQNICLHKFQLFNN